MIAAASSSEISASCAFPTTTHSDAGLTRCLKVGKAGPNSQARYVSQHYNPGSSRSNLAKSLLRKGDSLGIMGLNDSNVEAWIKHNTTRLDFLLDKSAGIHVLNLLEAFLQCRLKPAFEGFQSQK